MTERVLKKLEPREWRAALGWLPLFHVKKSKDKVSKGLKVKRQSLRLAPSRNLALTFRRFKTVKSSRSKRHKQIVLPLYFTSYKEVSIKLNKTKRKASASRRPVSFWRFAVSPVLIVAGLTGSIAFASQGQQSPPNLEPTRSFSVLQPAHPIAQPEKPAGLPRSEPTHINIPKVGISSGIMQVGNNTDGTIEVPPLYKHITGWYKHGPSPGEIGPAVIVGHVDTKDGPSVFWRLRQLQPGDVVEVSRADGQVVKFKVDSLKQFDQKNFPTEEVYGNIDHAGLRLITCGGTFNKKTGQYSHNTVVFASLIK